MILLLSIAQKIQFVKWENWKDERGVGREWVKGQDKIDDWENQNLTNFQLQLNRNVENIPYPPLYCLTIISLYIFGLC
jgi:hypothetical protein